MLTYQIIKKLQLEQQKLDDFIVKNKNITDTKNKGDFIWGKVALLVEIGELANELATFKRWKTQKKVDWKKAKEELIDCLHFYLSFTNSFQIDFFDYNQFKKNILEKSNDKDKNNVTACDLSSPQSIDRCNELLLQFFSVTMKMIKIKNNNRRVNKKDFYNWLIIFEELAWKMGMKNEEDIYKSYIDKNKKNWKRQGVSVYGNN